MFTPLRSLAVGLALTLPAMVHAQPSPAPPPLTDAFDELLILRVEMDGGDAVAAQLRPELLSSLRTAEVSPQLPGDAPLELTISLDTEQIGAYRVTFAHQGEPLGAWSCACSGDELLFRLRGATVTTWTELVDAAAADAAAMDEPPTPEPTTPPDLQERHARARTLWIAGMATFVGGVGVAAGGAVWMLGEVGSTDGVSPVAGVLLGTGVAITATGAALWGVGRRRMQRTQAQMAVGTPRHGRGLVFSIQGRF